MTLKAYDCGNIVLIIDTDPRRCRGLKARGCARCRRFGEPVDGAYYCPTHEDQREWQEQAEAFAAARRVLEEP